MRMIYYLRTKKFIALLLVAVCLTTCFSTFYRSARQVSAMPFYDLRPQQLLLRSKFFTSYPSSTEERKSNIKLAAKSLDYAFVDVGGEFSFNRTVGARTEKRGYKTAKIIVGGEFVDGVGGGVCQVSTTLYNAVLLAGLKVTEFHAHSLPVSYVAPSFDAMVNSGSADLKFINNTHNPVYIRAFADDATLTIEIYGEPMQEKYSRQSLVVEEIPAPESEVVFDDIGEFPDLYEGESKVLKYGKAGLKSEGYIVVSKNGMLKEVRKIRTDKYAAIRGKVVFGRAIKEIPNENIIDIENLPMEKALKEEKIKKSFVDLRKNFEKYKKTLTNNNFCDNIS